MTLQEALELIKGNSSKWRPSPIEPHVSPREREAIATIINAVVTGELRAEEKQDPYWATY